MDVRNARFLILECGTMPANGLELEVPKSAVGFFISGGCESESHTISFLLDDGLVHNCVMKRRPHNYMWRIVFNAEICYLLFNHGCLLPNRRRNHTVLFEKTKLGDRQVIKTTAILNQGLSYERLYERANNEGVVKITKSSKKNTARAYGWF